MTLLIRSFSLLLVSLGVLLASLLFLCRLERRRKWPLRYILCLVVMFGMSVFLSWFKGVIVSGVPENDGSILFFLLTYAITVVTHCIIFALGVVSVFVVFKVNAPEALFVGSAAYALQSLAMALSGVAMKLGGFNYQANVQDIIQQPFNLFVLLVFFAVVYVSAYFLCIREYEKENEFIGKMLAFLIIINFTNIIMTAVSVPPSEEIVADRLYMILIFSRIMLCGDGFFIQFTLANYYNLQVRQLALNRIMEQQKLQFEIAKESIDTVNINAHDLRKQISLILKENCGSVEEQLKKIEEKLNIVDTAFHTGNKALDITLTEKSRDCINKSIKFSAIAEGSCLEKMEDLDIYMLFGNLLDNAIEATENIPDKEDRSINFMLSEKCDCVSIHLENTFAREPKFINGVPVTTKKDKRFHGFGIKSIQNITRKYGGTFGMNIFHGMFCVDILFTSE